MGLFARRKTVFVDSDILVVGGGMAGCGAVYESRYWGRDLKIVCVEKANIERSGAVVEDIRERFGDRVAEMVADPTTRVPSYTTTAWPGAMP